MYGPAITRKSKKTKKKADVGDPVTLKALPNDTPIAGGHRRHRRRFSSDSEFLDRASHK